MNSAEVTLFFPSFFEDEENPYSTTKLLNTVLTTLDLSETRFRANIMFAPANHPNQHFEENQGKDFFHLFILRSSLNKEKGAVLAHHIRGNRMPAFYLFLRHLGWRIIRIWSNFTLKKGQFGKKVAF